MDRCNSSDHIAEEHIHTGIQHVTLWNLNRCTALERSVITVCGWVEEGGGGRGRGGGGGGV